MLKVLFPVAVALTVGLAGCARSSELEALRDRVAELEESVDILSSTLLAFEDGLEDKVSLSEIQSALGSGRIKVPAASIETPLFCGGELAGWNQFGDGLDCPFLGE